MAGYNLGLLRVGLNTIPGSVETMIEGTNTVEGTQMTPVTTSVSTTITDPDGSAPGTGDESATDGSSMSPTPTRPGRPEPRAINFREDTVTISAGGGPLHPAASSHRNDPGSCTIRFGCGPGTVAAHPVVDALNDPEARSRAPSIRPPTWPPTADAGPIRRWPREPA